MSADARRSVTEKRRALRDIISGEKIGILPGVFDGYSVNLVAARGYQAANISGAGLTNSRLAKPDVGIMGLESNLDGCRALCSAVDIPLFADGDTGYGNAVNVHYATMGFEDAGVGGVFFEDQTSPKRCGHMRGKDVIGTAEMVGKVLAAVDARRDEQLVIMARTDAAATHGVEEAIARGNAYLKAGADIIFPDALASVEDIKRAAGEIDGPVCVNMGFGIRSRATTPLMSPAEMERYGVSIAFYARLLTASAVQGMTLALEAFDRQVQTGEVEDRPDLCVSFQDLEGLVGLDEAIRLAEEYDQDGGRVRAVVAGERL